MLQKIIGVALIISAFVVEAMWLGVTFGSVVVGIVLLIFAPGILFAPFNILLAMGLAFLAYDKNARTYTHYESYRRDYENQSAEGNYSRRDNYHRGYQNHTQSHSHMKKYYDILGCNEGDDIQTIKQAYKQLSKKFHPDSVEGKGLDSAYVEFATKKMQEINEAYQMIKKERRI